VSGHFAVRCRIELRTGDRHGDRADFKRFGQLPDARAFQAYVETIRCGTSSPPSPEVAQACLELGK